ncbi:MAG: prepilin-type N-terminal cleavage/methylation domain-containing protein [Rhodoferax sp.]|nr:prepilin-type N-terminal cleavage/methylation domain-containing protein [Rhodoferax sp.]
MPSHRTSGFTLIELMIAVAVIAILARLALPSYQNYVVRGSRAAAQTELLQLASLQEKIYLNSSRYSASVTNAYNGTANGNNGLGSSGSTKDGKYSLSMVTPSDRQSFTLTATPLSSKSQAGDGNLSINQSGQRLWGSAAW